MPRFIVVRLIQAVVTLFVASIAIFLLVRLTGDPVHLMLPIESTEEDAARVRATLGLDKPLPVQYGIFISGIMRGDLGYSFKTKTPVTELIVARLPNSIALAVAAMAFALVFGIPLGIIAALKRGRPLDWIARIVAIVGQGVPGFWLGIVLIALVSVKLDLLPAQGMGGPLAFILPAFSLGWFLAAGIMRLVRSSMLEVLNQGFITLARVKGLPESWIILKHCFRNAMIPVVTFAGFMFSITIAAAISVETVFAWPGIGRLIYQAVVWREYQLIQGTVLAVVGIVLLINLLIDILYAWLDPRIRYGR